MVNRRSFLVGLGAAPIVGVAAKAAPPAVVPSPAVPVVRARADPLRAITRGISELVDGSVLVQCPFDYLTESTYCVYVIAMTRSVASYRVILIREDGGFHIVSNDPKDCSTVQWTACW